MVYYVFAVYFVYAPVCCVVHVKRCVAVVVHVVANLQMMVMNHQIHMDFIMFEI